jgi:hypothetical protein
VESYETFSHYSHGCFVGLGILGIACCRTEWRGCETVLTKDHVFSGKIDPIAELDETLEFAIWERAQTSALRRHCRHLLMRSLWPGASIQLRAAARPADHRRVLLLGLSCVNRRCPLSDGARSGSSSRAAAAGHRLGFVPPKKACWILPDFLPEELDQSSAAPGTNVARAQSQP